MSDFEFVFVLYSLVLGLSVVEILGGFGRALELRLAQTTEGADFRIGWLTPLLAIFVLLDLLSFWSFAWTLRDTVQVSPRMLLAVMTFAAAYFMAARLVFPTAPARFASLDEQYFRVRRIVMGILIALVGVQWAYLASIPAMRAALASPLTIALTLVLVCLMFAAAFVKDRRWSIAILVLLVGRYTLIYLR